MIIIILEKFNNLSATKFLRNKVIKCIIILYSSIDNIPFFSSKDNFITKNRCYSKRACVSFIELVVKFSLIVLSRRRDKD